jgi:hypothetical protein
MPNVTSRVSYLPTRVVYAKPLTSLASTWTDNVVTMTEIGSTGVYSGTLDDVISYAFFERFGANPSASDGPPFLMVYAGIDALGTTAPAGWINNAALADNAIGASKVASDTITAAKIASDAITAAKIATDAITATKIASGAITSAKIATDAIGASQIAANAITSAKIATAAIGDTQIASNAITSAKIAANAIGATQVADNTITAAKIATDAITATKVADNTITAGKIASNAITSAKIAADAIGASQIANGALAASKFASGAFDAVWGVTTRTLTEVANSIGVNTLLDRVTGIIRTKAQADADQVVLLDAIDEKINVSIVPAVGISSARSPGITLKAFVGETVETAITLYQTDGITPIVLTGKTLVIPFETRQGGDVATVGSSDITITGPNDNVVSFDMPAAATMLERTLRFAIRDAAAPNTVYLQGVLNVTRAAQVDA